MSTNGDAAIQALSEENFAIQTMAEEYVRINEAAERSDANAQNDLGVMYANGRGVPKDEKQAVEWYRKAAEQGYAMAQKNLDKMHANGWKDDKVPGRGNTAQPTKPVPPPSFTVKAPASGTPDVKRMDPVARIFLVIVVIVIAWQFLKFAN